MATTKRIAMHARLFTKSNAEGLHRKGKALQREVSRKPLKRNKGLKAQRDASAESIPICRDSA